MRILLVIVIVVSSVAVKAQTVLPVSFMDYIQRESFGNYNHSVIPTSNKKWFVSTYSSISTSYNFFGGGNAMIIAAPMGIQLNRRLTNNLYAFAGVSVAPAYINFNSAFLSPNINKGYPNNGPFRSNSFDIYTKAEMGLMYVNDAKTFSVSGSVSVARSSYPVIPYPQRDAANHVSSSRK